MTNLVPASEIEQIVGHRRHATDHLGRAITDQQTVYILHSVLCRDSGIDLRECGYSKALDNGIALNRWENFLDRPGVKLAVEHGRLVPDAVRRPRSAVS